MVDPPVLSSRAGLDDELGSLLFDPVNEWLLDLDQSKGTISEKLEFQPVIMEESDKGVIFEGVVVDSMKQSDRVNDVEEDSSTGKQATLESADSSTSEEEEEEDRSENSNGSDDEQEEEEEEDSSSTNSSSSSSDSEEESSEQSKLEKRLEEGIEEGEIIMESDGGGEEEEGEEAEKGPFRSKHELQILPPVPKIEVQLEPHHETVPVGTITSILGDHVIVEGSVKHNPLNEGSVLFITDTHKSLGLIDEVFGPVKNPFYIVRYNSPEELPPGISVGSAVSFVSQFADHILNDKDVYKKGYDASGENDEEIGDEFEFSDDEKEAEYKRSLRQSKREFSNNNNNNSNKKKSGFQYKSKGSYGRRGSGVNAPGTFLGTMLPVQHQQTYDGPPPGFPPQQQLQTNDAPPPGFPPQQQQNNGVPPPGVPAQQQQQMELLQKQLLMSLNFNCFANQIPFPGFGFNPNPNPNPLLPFMANLQFNPGNPCFPNMQFNPANSSFGSGGPPMQSNPGNLPFGGERSPLQFNPANPCFDGGNANLQLNPGNSSFGGEGSSMQFNQGSSSFSGLECPLQFNPGNSSNLQFNPGNSSFGGEHTNLQFSPGNSSFRGRRAHQRGRGRGRGRGQGRNFNYRGGRT